jgi:hypothetical protein
MTDSKPPVRYPGTGTPEDECPPSDEFLAMFPSVSAYDAMASNYEGRITPLLMKERSIDNKIEWVQWNVTLKENGLPLGRDCLDHPAVRGTDYMEVHALIGTSGCSTEHPHYTWSVMGVIATKHGKQLVCPGDWIGTLVPGVYIVMTDVEYRSYGEGE